MLKRFFAILPSLLALLLLLSLSGCAQTAPSREELSSLVGDAILSDNAGTYYDGECCGEGHVILGTRLSGARLKVYALTMYGNYGFQNDMFIKVSGSGVIPAVLTFEKSGDDWRLLGMEYPLDGAGYTRSIRRMFPLRYRSAALHGDNMHAALISQERQYAGEYLQSIGREAVIGEYRDLHTVLLTDCGVSVEVSNRLIADKRLGDYPYWIGTSEYLAGGKRYIRSLSLDESASQIRYKTVERESGAVIEVFFFDALTGEEISPPT